MLILLDCDNVVYDMMAALKARCPGFDPKGVTDYHFETETYGVPREQIMDCFTEQETFEKEPLCKGAKEGVRQLQSIAQVVGWTDIPGPIQDYRRWQFKKVGVRKVILDKTIPDWEIDAVIDDNPEQLWRFPPEVQKFCIAYPYNADKELPPNCTRVRNLIEVHQILRKQVRRW